MESSDFELRKLNKGDFDEWKIVGDTSLFTTRVSTKSYMKRRLHSFRRQHSPKCFVIFKNNEMIGLVRISFTDNWNIETIAICKTCSLLKPQRPWNRTLSH